MSVDKELLEAIGQMMDQKLTANNQELREEMAIMMDTKLEEQGARIINQMNAIIESKVTPQIKTVAEQHGEIIDRLDKLEGRRETSQALRSHVRTLEDVVKTHTDRIEALEAKIG